MFKFLLLLICFAVALSLAKITEEMKELAAQLHKTCVTETGVAEDTISAVNKDKVLSNDEKFKCYLNCLMAKTAVADDNGVVDPEAFINLLPEEFQTLARPTIEKCGSKTGANPCESVWLTHQCYITERPDLYMII